MIGKFLAVALVATLGLAMPATSAKKLNFTRAPASLEIDTSGRYAVGCVSRAQKKGCNRLYTASKTRAGKTMFNKVRSAKASLRKQGRYWEQCNMSGCYIVYSGTGGLYGGEY